MILGSCSDVRVTGGDMLQANGQSVQVSGISLLKFTAGGDSHGNGIPSQTNRGVFMENGANVTNTIVPVP